MRMAVYYTLCTAGMIGFYFFCKFLVIGISPDFGYGAGVGVAITIILFWLNEKIDGKHKRQ